MFYDSSDCHLILSYREGCFLLIFISSFLHQFEDLIKGLVEVWPGYVRAPIHVISIFRAWRSLSKGQAVFYKIH